MKVNSRPRFLTRLFKFRHWEVDSALQQVLWTLLQPKRLFRYHQSQNEMRGYWCRDDPSFLLLLCAALGVSSLFFSVWMSLSLSGYLLALLWAVLVDGLLAGAAVATAMWLLTGHALKQSQSSTGGVEWAYCFDVHLNAFFPLLLTVYGVQLVAWPLLARPNILSCLCSNTLWSVGILYYIYITFLGYTVLPSVRPMSLLYGGVPVFFFLILSLLFVFNYSLLFKNYHSWRTGG